MQLTKTWIGYFVVAHAVNMPTVKVYLLWLGEVCSVLNARGKHHGVQLGSDTAKPWLSIIFDVIRRFTHIWILGYDVLDKAL